MTSSEDYLKTLNVGAEGEVPNVVQTNIQPVLDAGDNFVASRNGEPIGVRGIREAGPLIIADPTNLPFKDGAFEEVIANGVPIDTETFLGKGYSYRELCRVCRSGFLGVKVDGQSPGPTFVRRNFDI